MAARDRQISVRVSTEADEWLEQRAGGRSRKAGLLRTLIEQEMARERQQRLREMFDTAAREVDELELEERESLLGGFSGARGDTP